MRDNKYFDELGKPFPASDISWRMQYVDKTRGEGFAVPYLDARAIADRLDAVVGQNRWKNSYEQWHNGSQLCTIYIYDEELHEWIGKTDGAENTDIEPVKGGLSDAFKRSAVKWNIGRYLYGFAPVWVKTKLQGKSYVIDTDEILKLNAAYNKRVAELFGKVNAQDKQPEPKPQPKPAMPNTATPQPNTPVYEIRNIQTESGENGGRCMMILSCGDKRYKVFMNSTDGRLKTGTRLKNLKSKKVQNAYGSVTMLASYDIAA